MLEIEKLKGQKMKQSQSNTNTFSLSTINRSQQKKIETKNTIIFYSIMIIISVMNLIFDLQHLFFISVLEEK